MRYRDLKQERDDAIARAVEAERLSMKSEFDRVTREFEEKEQRLLTQAAEDVKEAYQLGFEEGQAVLEAFIVHQLKQHREPSTQTEFDNYGDGRGIDDGFDLDDLEHYEKEKHP